MVVKVFTMGNSKGSVRKCFSLTQKQNKYAHLNSFNCEETEEKDK